MNIKSLLYIQILLLIIVYSDIIIYEYKITIVYSDIVVNYCIFRYNYI